MPPHTTPVTLYRLEGVPPTVAGMKAAFDGSPLDRWDAQLGDVSGHMGVPALLITASTGLRRASWCDTVARATGVRIETTKRRTAALIVVAVDDDVYVVGFDEGYRLVPDGIMDPRFGLSFAIRQVNPQQVRGLVASALGQARTDIALTPGGTDVLTLGVRDHAQLVSRIAGYLDATALTHARNSRGSVTSVEGGRGLRMRIGIDSGDLVSDIREIARVRRNREPHPDLGFVEHIIPVRDPATRQALDDALEDMLARPHDGRLAIAVPEDCHDAYAQAAAFGVKAGGRLRRVDDLTPEHLTAGVRLREPGNRLTALRRGKVHVYGSHETTESDLLATTGALRWIEAEISLGARRFCLRDQAWYEIGAAFLRGAQAVVARVISPNPATLMPPWPQGKVERDYNNEVSGNPGWEGFVNLDCGYVRNPFKRHNVMEVCDHLAPDGSLVLVKPAHGRSGPLSHLFNQGLVTIQLLQNSASVRREFATLVRERTAGRRVLPEDFVPKRVVFAIHLRRGTALTPGTLPAFSQVALAHTVRTLEQWGVAVEVVGIDDADPVADAVADPALTEAAAA